MTPTNLLDTIPLSSLSQGKPTMPPPNIHLDPTLNCPRLVLIQTWHGTECGMQPSLIPCGQPAMTALCPLDLPNPVRTLEVVPLENLPVYGNGTGNGTINVNGNANGTAHGHGSGLGGTGGVDRTSMIVTVVVLALFAWLMAWVVMKRRLQAGDMPWFDFDAMFEWIGVRVGA